MTIDKTIFASSALAAEIKEFPDIKRGLGIEPNGKPQLKHMNSLFNRIDKKYNDLAETGIAEYDSTASYNIGDIAKVSTHQDVLFISLKNSNKNNPVTNTTYWKPFVTSSSTSTKGVVQLTNKYTETDKSKAVNIEALQEGVRYAIDNSFGVAGSVNVGFIHWGLTLDPTSLHLNGQAVSRTTYPALWDYVDKKLRSILVSEADWQAEYKKYGICGKFSTGNGTSTFRLPVFEYVKGSTSLSDIGKIQEPSVPNITGSFAVKRYSLWTSTGAFYQGYNVSAQVGNGTDYDSGYCMFDASRSSEVYGKSLGDVVDVLSVKGFWQIKAVGNIIVDDPTDVKNVYDQLNILNNKVKEVYDNMPKSVVLYPGGSETNPPMIKVGDRIVINNPYKTMDVLVKVELSINSGTTWGSAGNVVYDAGGYGTDANPLNDGTIVVQAGSRAVLTSSQNTGSPLNSQTFYSTLPYRVRIIKLC